MKVPPRIAAWLLLVALLWLQSAWQGVAQVPGDAALLAQARIMRDAGQHEALSQLVEGKPEGMPKPEGFKQPLVGWFAGEALLEMGKAAQALELAGEWDRHFPKSLVGAFLRYQEALWRGDTVGAREIARERLKRRDLSEYWVERQRQAADWVMLGKLRLAAGEDAKRVMEQCFQRALREDGDGVEAIEAMVELALEKGDASMAVQRAKEGLQKAPKHARLLAWLGQALAWSSPKEALERWEEALRINPKESLARVFLAEAAFRREDERTVEEQLKGLASSRGEAAAFGLAQSFMGGESVQKGEAARKAEKRPLVLQRAGHLLVARYRFEEAAECFKASLVLDPERLEAKRGLGECLLRLGKAEEAWPLLEEVHRLDGYDVGTFNLLEFRDRVAGFQVLETPHFQIRMAPNEAVVYGDRVGALLERAYGVLSEKYRIRLKQRTLIEIFPEQRDFAVRTFGVPGGDGFLGVCFGVVITAPSPGSARASGHSWEATLWHELTHTVTLALTRHAIPRWLGEGISVYEEQQAQAGWGQRFRVEYATRLLTGKVTPLEAMGEPFRSGDGRELDFGYFQAGLVVEWMVHKGGMELLRGLLGDLAQGKRVEVALERRLGSWEKANQEFLEYAQRWVKKRSGTMRFRAAPAPSQGEGKEAVPARVYEEELEKARAALKGGKRAEAREVLERVMREAPEMGDEEGAIPLLAGVYRELGLEREEASLWERGLMQVADLDGAHARLLELYRRWKDWPKGEAAALRSLGVQPMALSGVQLLVDAREAQGRVAEAVEGCRKALVLDVGNSARWHARLGRLLEGTDAKEAREQVLLALERNPRDQMALQVLRRLARSVGKEAAGGANAAGKESKAP